VYPKPRPETSSLSPALLASPLSFSALSVKGACPGRVGVLRETRSLTHTNPSAPLIPPRCPSPLSFARVHINIIPWDLGFLCFHTLTHSFAMHKTLSHLLSGISALFNENTRGGRRPPLTSHSVSGPVNPIPFIITFFAHPLPINPIESYSCKKQGRWWYAIQGRSSHPITNHFHLFPQRVNIRPTHKHRQLQLFHAFTDNLLYTVGISYAAVRHIVRFRRLPDLPILVSHWSRNTGHVLSALSLSTFNCRLSTSPLPQNFYPHAGDLRHNPAAQGRHPQPIPRAGRIQ
jgi:hypothetical protein